MKKYFKQLWLVLPLVAFVIVAFYACQDRAVAPVYNNQLSGVVQDPQNYGVPNAILKATDMSNKLLATDTTDVYGNFTLTGLPADLTQAKVQIITPDFKEFDGKLSDVVKGQDPKKVPIKLMGLDTCHGVLIITVVDKSTNKTVPDANVRLNHNHDLIRNANTNDSGVIVFNDICANSYWVRISKDGYSVLESDNFQQDGTDTTRLTYQISPQDSCCNGIITVTIKDSTNNNPLTGAIVYLYKNGVQLGYYYTNTSGQVVFTGICDGSYSITYSKDGYNHSSYAFTVTCNDTLSINKLLSPTCCDGIVVVSPVDTTTKQIINGASVSIRLNGTVLNTYSVIDNRPVTFRGLCEGTYTFLISATGYNTTDNLSVTIHCHDSLNVSKALAKSGDTTCCDGIVVVTPTDTVTGSIINGASVSIRQNGTTLSTLTVSDKHPVVFNHLCAGTYGFLISASGYTSTDNLSVTIKCHDSINLAKALVSVHSDTCYTAILKLNLKIAGTDSVLAGAMVRVYINDHLITSGTSNSEGNFEVDTLQAPATYTVKITKDGYVENDLTYTYTECNTKNETVQMQKK